VRAGTRTSTRTASPLAAGVKEENEQRELSQPVRSRAFVSAARSRRHRSAVGDRRY
jgi:hypothetical protein